MTRKQVAKATLSWTNATDAALGPAVPSPRTGAQFAPLPDGGLALFGGWDETALHFFNDLFVLDPAALAWRSLPPAGRARGAVPAPVSGHGFAALGGTVYLFGGVVNVAGTAGTDSGTARL